MTDVCLPSGFEAVLCAEWDIWRHPGCKHRHKSPLKWTASDRALRAFAQGFAAPVHFAVWVTF